MKQDILSQGSIAIIFQTTDCDCVNITLPNINIHLKRCEFNSFVYLINRITKENILNCSTKETILVPSPYQEVNLHFRLSELRELRSIIRAANLKLQGRDLKFDMKFSQN